MLAKSGHRNFDVVSRGIGGRTAPPSVSSAISQELPPDPIRDAGHNKSTRSMDRGDEDAGKDCRSNHATDAGTKCLR